MIHITDCIILYHPAEKKLHAHSISLFSLFSHGALKNCVFQWLEDLQFLVFHHSINSWPDLLCWNKRTIYILETRSDCQNSGLLRTSLD
jgi:hypothetical protein